MYKFHYDTMKVRFPESLMMKTDTDSFLYYIKTDDLYKDMANHMDEFDLSEYPRDNSEYFKELIVYIEKTIKNKNSTLEGLDEGLNKVLDPKQKEWAKNNLLQQLIFELKIRSEV